MRPYLPVHIRIIRRVSLTLTKMLNKDTTDDTRSGKRYSIYSRSFTVFCMFILSMLVFYCLLDINLSGTRLQKNSDVTSRDKRNMTIISAYFNLGTFRKGARAYISPNHYRKWAISLTRMRNPLVFYTDDPFLKYLIENGRKNISMRTTVIFIAKGARERMWTFALRDKIDAIYKDPAYPKYYPSTVNADYTCVQHAKYELVMNTIDRKLYVADYYAWLDIGYFRKMSRSSVEFRLEVPSDLHPDKIAYTQIQPIKSDLSITTVIRGNKLWLGGGMFIGIEGTLRKFIAHYKQAVNVFLSRGLTNVDQQIIYAMFTEGGKKLISPSVEPQIYIPPRGRNPWFYLGFVCLKEDNAVT